MLQNVMATVFNQNRIKPLLACSLSLFIKITRASHTCTDVLLRFFPLEIDLFRSVAALVDDNFDRLDDAELFLL